jgi:hypothetical protein
VGGLVIYMSDVMGFVEGTLFMAMLTALAFIGSVMYAAQVFLEESFWNVSFVLVVGILMFFTYVLFMSFFYGIADEFSSMFQTLEVLILASLPLVASSLITWFLCVELPSLDIVTTFSMVYFFYVLLCCSPRPVRKQLRSKR